MGGLPVPCLTQPPGAWLEEWKGRLPIPSDRGQITPEGKKKAGPSVSDAPPALPFSQFLQTSLQTPMDTDPVPVFLGSERTGGGWVRVWPPFLSDRTLITSAAQQLGRDETI